VTMKKINKPLHRVFHDNIYLMGDFNVNLMRYHGMQPIADFCNSLISQNFTPLINRPTRVTTTTATLIDNIFSNRIRSLTAGVVVTDVSDHFGTIAFEQIDTEPVNNETRITYREYNEANKENFMEALTASNWDDVRSTHNANVAYQKFLELLMELYETHFPLLSKTINDIEQKKPWISNGLRTSIKAKRKLYRKYIKK